MRFGNAALTSETKLSIACMSVCEMIARNMSGTCKTSVQVYGSNGSRDKSPTDIVASAVHNQQKYNITAFPREAPWVPGGLPRAWRGGPGGGLA